MKYIDLVGLSYFWNKIKNVFSPIGHTHTKSEVTDLAVATTSVNGLMSAADKTKLNSAASLYSYSATLTTTWSGSGPYTQTVAVAGILSTDTPIIDVKLSTTTTTAMRQLEAYNYVSKIVTSNGNITATCLTDKPLVALSLQIKVIR